MIEVNKKNQIINDGLIIGSLASNNDDSLYIQFYEGFTVKAGDLHKLTGLLRFVVREQNQNDYCP